MNTDPWVFHPGFVWSVCRHKAITAEIHSGDLVLFGSALGGNWVLDTVMVVDRRTEGKPGKIGGVYDHLVLPTIQDAFRPFIGKPRQDVGPFSFAPAMRADDGHKPFRRPAINRLLSSLRKVKDGKEPSPGNAQALVFCETKGDISSFWKALVEEVERAGLVLGTVFHHPSSVDGLKAGVSDTGLCVKSNSGWRPALDEEPPALPRSRS